MPIHAPKLPDVITRENYHYADFVPYYTPDTLDDLQGPTDGVVEAALNVSTAFNRKYDLSNQAELLSLYSATIRDGTQDQQEAALNKDHVVRLWPQLNLPTRCRRIWETEFPQLVQGE